MEIQRWQPLSELMSLRQAMDRLFEDSFVRPSQLPSIADQAIMPALDIYQTENDVVVKATLPGVRPEDVIMSLGKKQDFITSKVYVLESTGSYNIIDVVLDSLEKIRVRTLSTVNPIVNENVFLNFDMDRVTMFDPETEEAIR